MGDYEDRAFEFLREYAALVERFGVRLRCTETQLAADEIEAIDVRAYPGRYEPVLGEDTVIAWHEAKKKQ
jgi:hypothetical protein